MSWSQQPHREFQWPCFLGIMPNPHAPGPRAEAAESHRTAPFLDSWVTCPGEHEVPFSVPMCTISVINHLSTSLSTNLPRPKATLSSPGSKFPVQLSIPLNLLQKVPDHPLCLEPCTQKCVHFSLLFSSQCDTIGQLCPAQGTQHLQSNQTWTGQPRGKCYGFPVSHIIPEEKTLLDPGWKKEKLGQCRELAKKGPEEPVTFTAPEHLPWASLLPLTLCQAKLGTWSSSASGKQCRIYGIFS